MYNLGDVIQALTVAVTQGEELARKNLESSGLYPGLHIQSLEVSLPVLVCGYGDDPGPADAPGEEEFVRAAGKRLPALASAIEDSFDHQIAMTDSSLKKKLLGMVAAYLQRELKQPASLEAFKRDMVSVYKGVVAPGRLLKRLEQVVTGALLSGGLPVAWWLKAVIMVARFVAFPLLKRWVYRDAHRCEVAAIVARAINLPVAPQRKPLLKGQPLFVRFGNQALQEVPAEKISTFTICWRADGGVDVT